MQTGPTTNLSGTRSPGITAPAGARDGLSSAFRMRSGNDRAPEQHRGADSFDFISARQLPPGRQIPVCAAIRRMAATGREPTQRPIDCEQACRPFPGLSRGYVTTNGPWPA